MSEQQECVSKSSSSSISSSTQESEEDLTIGNLVTEATNSGKSLRRRLSHLNSIPHTPRVNGKIPDFNNATIDHESLLERDTRLVEIVPRDATPTRELWLSFWCEVHYNSLYAIEDPPTRKTKKKHWLF